MSNIPGVFVHTFNPSALRRQKLVGLSEFQTTLVFIAIYRSARTR